MENSKKLDRLLALIEGEENAPGLLGRVAAHDKTLYGIDGSNGVVNKVNVMWRAHVWLLCSMSGIAGFLLKDIMTKAVK